MKVFKILVLLSIFIISSGCFLKKEEVAVNVGTNELISQESSLVKEKTLANLAISKEKASNWKENAVFVGYNIDVPKDMDPKSVVETFVFGSPDEEDYWWTYSISSDGQGVRALINKEDYLGSNLIIIEENFWKISYTDAIKTAESAGGLNFRAENPKADMTLLLRQGEPNGWLWYSIEYQGSANKLQVRISANDGKVYDNKGNLKNN